MKTNEKFVITINRELGSGGHTVGSKLAKLLGVKYYDKAIIEGLTQKYGMSADQIERLKADKKSWWESFKENYLSLPASGGDGDGKPTTAMMFETERHILESLAREESCVVAGRTAFLIFREWKNRVNVFIQATTEHRIERLMSKGMNYQAALDTIDEVDEGREAYLRKYSDRTRYDTRNYDLVITMDDLTEDDAVAMILDFINRTSK